MKFSIGLNALLLALFATSAFFLSISPESRASYMPSPEVLGSPVLLQNYAGWNNDDTAFYSRGSETRAYADLLHIVYDADINRPWGDAYFPEAESRLETFRARVCPALPSPIRICSVPVKMESENDISELKVSLTDDALNRALEERWGVRIENVKLPNASREFNLELGHGQLKYEPAPSSTYWNFIPESTSRFTMIPLMPDVDTYLASFGEDDFPAYFALTSRGILLNDWQIRDHAMTFAAHWKFTIQMNRIEHPANPATESEEIQHQLLFEENQALFNDYYDALLPNVQGKKAVLARFLKERADGDYPEEVYQHVAYRLLNDLLHMQSAYYKLAETQRQHTLNRHKALESLLTLERYSPAPRIFLIEAQTLGVPFAPRAAVLDQAVSVSAATAFAMEHLNLILGLFDYAHSHFFEKYGYAVLANELFDAQYLKNYQPGIYQELLQPDGNLKRIETLPMNDQIRILRKYLVTADGGFSLSGFYRMAGVFRLRIRETDLHRMAEIIHATHAGEFH